MNKANLKRHDSYKRAKLDIVNALLWSLDAQQATFTRPQSDRDSVTQAGFEVSELKQLKS